MPPTSLRHQPTHATRLTRLSLGGLLGLVSVLAVSCTSGRPHGPSPATARRGRSPTTAGGGGPVGAVKATLEPWHLAAPLSREVVLPDGADLTVLGGLDATGTSVSGVFSLDPATGRLLPAGTLALPTHDAGGAVLGGVDLVVGGGASAIYDTVQGIRVSGGGSAVSGSAAAFALHSLPQPRADLSVATSGGVAYVVGGYDGPTLDPAVLATNDGRTFRVVAQLAHPVRYPAVAVVGHQLYVLGGQTASQATQVTAAIQRVDLSTGRTTVVGNLPVPVAGAEAIVEGGQVLVLGGLVGGQPSAGIVRFDPGTGSVASVAQLPEAVANAGAAVVGGVGYLVGGEGPGPLASVVRIQTS